MPKNRLLKQQEAKTRQENRNKRSAKDQLNLLDTKFGKSVGALKERTRLNNIINKKEEVKKEEVVETEENQKPKRKSKKKKEK